MIDQREIIQRMTQMSVMQRYAEQQVLSEVLSGTYAPEAGHILPAWKAGSSRRLAWERAVRKTQTEGPRVLSERIASSLGRLSITNADTGESDPKLDESLEPLDLDSMARELVEDFISHGIAALIPYEAPEGGGANLDRLTGMVETYVDPHNTNRVNGLFRTVSYYDTSGAVKWRTEVYDWDDSGDGQAVHRYWSNLAKPAELGFMPEEYPDAPRPIYAIDRMTDDGLPVGQLESANPLMLGLYATELMLATAEEVSAYPMLKVKGSTRHITQVGVGEVLGVDSDGDAEWMEPGNLEQLRARRAEKRAAVREATFLYAGSLGTETPSGEALIQANRVPMQADSDTARAISRLLTDGVNRYQELVGGPAVQVDIEPDQTFQRQVRLQVLKMGDDMGAIPFAVKARAFQAMLGAGYTSEELERFIEENEPPAFGRELG